MPLNAARCLRSALRAPKKLVLAGYGAYGYPNAERDLGIASCHLLEARLRVDPQAPRRVQMKGATLPVVPNTETARELYRSPGRER